MADATHLFIVCPNNSGSTLLVELLGTSAHASIFPSLNHEGQWVAKAAGDGIMPYPEGRERRNWTINAEKFANPDNYDWPRLTGVWNAAWDTGRSVRVEKTPSLVISAPLFQSRFADARFILCVRDPYAFCEGVRRREGYDVGTAARHWMRCAELQLRNQQLLAPQLFITYEALCNHTDDVVRQIAAFVPELADLDAERVFDVMSHRSEIRDQNRAQIARLTREDLVEINHVLAPDVATLRRLGYDLLDAREHDAVG